MAESQGDDKLFDTPPANSSSSSSFGNMKWDSITITDASSEGDLVTFVIASVKICENGQKHESTVTRKHEDFSWLHGSIFENSYYDGFIIPPCPPRPDFEGPREKFYRLNEEQSELTTEEYDRLKAELDGEYLRLFKKTVAYHEVFLLRLTQHPTFKSDEDLRIFLQYENDLQVRTSNTRERFSLLMSRVQQSADTSLRFSGQLDPDDYFTKQRVYFQIYLPRNKEAGRTYGNQLDSLYHIGHDCYLLCASLFDIGSTTQDSMTVWKRSLHIMTVYYDSYRTFIQKLATDCELKLLDLLKDDFALGSAAKDMLYKRSKDINNFTSASKKLEGLRKKKESGKPPNTIEHDIKIAEGNQTQAWERLDNNSSRGKSELQLFHSRRVTHFREYLTDYANQQLSHNRELLATMRQTIADLQKL